MANWFCHVNGQQLGPLADAALQQMARTGQLQPGDLVWQEGMPNWVPASTIPNLFGAAPPPPPINYGQPAYGQPGYGQPAYGQPYTGATGPGRDWLTTLLLCLFVGGFGAHRFYTGHTGIGIAQLVTLGGCGVWALIDLITILTGSYRDANGQPLLRR